MTGTYKLEVWGASGGGNPDQSVGSHRGLGGYSFGRYATTASSTLHIFIGGEGKAPTVANPLVGVGGYNGGGNGCFPSSDEKALTGCAGGGGMTHISTANNPVTTETWSPTGTLIVAGGGGGADDFNEVQAGSQRGDNDGSGGYGGGEIGGWGRRNGPDYNPPGGQSVTIHPSLGISSVQGKGCDALGSDTGGGGGGWYGGLSSNASSGAGGGSGYIGGVNSPKETIAGNTSFPAPGGGSETGHAGNGYARITLTR